MHPNRTRPAGSTTLRILWAFADLPLTRAFRNLCEVTTVAELFPECGTLPANLHIEEVLIRYRLARRCEPDWIFFNESYIWHVLQGLEDCAIPKVAYSLDPHTSYPWLKDYAKAFARFWVSDRKYLPLMQDAGSVNVSWFPAFFPGSPEDVRRFDPDRPRAWDVVFIGDCRESGHPGRAAFMKEFCNLLGSDYRVHIGAGRVLEYCPNAKIVLNDCLKGELNLRTMEAVGCGALLLTDRRAQTQFELFPEGEAAAGYDYRDAADAARIARYYLERPEERTRLARCGWERLMHRFTADHCARAILEELASVPREPPVSHLESCYYLGRAFTRLALYVNRFEESDWNDLFLARVAEAMRLLQRIPTGAPFFPEARFLIHVLQRAQKPSEYPVPDEALLRLPPFADRTLQELFFLALWGERAIIPSPPQESPAQ